VRNKIIIPEVHVIFDAGCEAINNQIRLNFVSKFKTVKCEIYPRYDFNGSPNTELKLDKTTIIVNISVLLGGSGQLEQNNCTETIVSTDGSQRQTNNIITQSSVCDRNLKNAVNV
jgi:hypothetical protein